MANNLTKAPTYMSVLEIVLVQLLHVCELALMCRLHFNFVFMHLHWEQVIRQVQSGHTGGTYSRRGTVWSKFEVPNYLLSVQMHEDKVEVYTSVQVHIR